LVPDFPSCVTISALSEKTAV